MKAQAILEGVKQIGQEANQITDGRTNWGGCGVFAYLLAKRLSELGIETVGIVQSRYVNDAQEAFNKRSRYMDHVIVRFRVGKKTFLADSDEVWPSDKPRFHPFPIVEGELTLEQLKELAEDGSWVNPTFPRRTIPRIARMIKKWTPESTDTST